jgi:hypothetical protein
LHDGWLSNHRGIYNWGGSNRFGNDFRLADKLSNHFRWRSFNWGDLSRGDSLWSLDRRRYFWRLHDWSVDFSRWLGST